MVRNGPNQLGGRKKPTAVKKVVKGFINGDRIIRNRSDIPNPRSKDKENLPIGSIPQPSAVAPPLLSPAAHSLADDKSYSDEDFSVQGTSSKRRYVFRQPLVSCCNLFGDSHLMTAF